MTTIEKMTAIEKRVNVPLDEALNIAGTGRYTYYVIFTTGFLFLTGMLNVEAMAMVLPATSCDLQLSSTEKGMLTSMALAGMLFPGPVPGFLSDAYGRTIITFYGQAASTVLLLLSSIAPNTITLMALCFVNGITLTGAFTPAYVLVSEFSPTAMKAKALIIASCLSSLANVVLPSLAWLVMPLDVDLPILNFITFTPWRLFLVILTIPMFMAMLLVWKLPETPKFLLNEGKSEATMEVLRSIYAINNKKRPEEYPVISVVLDSSDEKYTRDNDVSNPFLRSVKDMSSRTSLLFSRDFILYTVIACILCFTQVGGYYVFMLWFPEQLSRLKQYSTTYGVHNVTLCELMSSSSIYLDGAEDCQLKYDFFSYCIMLGIIQCVSGVIVSTYADRVGKKLLLTCMLMASGGVTSLLVFLDVEYLIILTLSGIIVVISMAFPLIMALIMEIYPTYARSTASAVVIIFGRLGGAGGSQLLGLLYENHCEHAYFGVTGLLIASAMLCLILPSKKKS